jgi:hypothetical protein
VNLRFVPIELWPGDARKQYQRKDSPFRGSWGDTLKTLDRELNHLRARDILVQGYFELDDIRLDGWPRSTARPRGPGVILTFETPNGTLSFPCDTYTRWEDNFRAIALALDALRRVERYGVTRRNEQYKGWAKLPPAPAKMSADDAMTFLGLHSEVRPINGATFNDVYRSAARKLHPDNQDTGNVHLFHLLGEAKQALSDLYGWK